MTTVKPLASALGIALLGVSSLVPALLAKEAPATQKDYHLAAGDMVLTISPTNAAITGMEVLGEEILSEDARLEVGGFQHSKPTTWELESGPVTIGFEAENSDSVLTLRCDDLPDSPGSTIWAQFEIQPNSNGYNWGAFNVGDIVVRFISRRDGDSSVDPAVRYRLPLKAPDGEGLMIRNSEVILPDGTKVSRSKIPERWKLSEAREEEYVNPAGQIEIDEISEVHDSALATIGIAGDRLSSMYLNAECSRARLQLVDEALSFTFEETSTDRAQFWLGFYIPISF